MRFLKDYNKKLYFLFQKQIEESIRHLNNTLDKTYREKINKHFEFQDSMGEYQLMLEEAVDETLAENVKELISSLENEYNTDMETITNSENKKMQQITQHYAKKQLKNNVVIGNLNIETLGEIVNIFK
jgi:oligoendopeptidase F